MSKTPLGDSALEILQVQAENLHYLMTQAYEAIERVRELHKPFGDKSQWCDHCEIGANSGYDWADYPCDTIKALDGITDEA